MDRTRLLSWILVLTGLLTASPAFAVYKICIDPGHGGSDPGAVGCGLEEAAVVLDVSLRLKNLMQADPDLTPIMTRTTDIYVSLGGRVAYANDNGAHRFASIHANAFNGSATGIETFCYSNGSASSFDQRDRIQEGMTSIWPALTDRGGKTAGFYVIKYTNMPASLSELAFIDNCGNDALYLADPDERQAAAVAHHQAIRMSLNLSGSTPDPDPDPGPDPVGTGVLRGVIFEDQGVGTADMSIRIPGALVKANDGGQLDDELADVPDADWLIALPAGTYTVTASAVGYYENVRVCTVTMGQDSWCSIGLFIKDDDPPLDPEVPDDPPLDPEIPDGPKGTLLGTVFVEQGSGTTDMSIRLPGAVVKVVGAIASDTVTTDGEWGLFNMSLPPGTYEVTAALQGYWPNTRLCTVSVDTETWCSLGLWPEDQQPPDDPTPGYGDAGPGDPEEDDPPEIHDPAVPDPGQTGSGEQALDEYQVQEDVVGCGSSTAARPGAIALLLAALAGLLGLRRRRCAALAVLALLVAAPPTSAGDRDGHFKVIEAHALTSASGYGQPVWSPDGETLAFAGEGFDALLIVPVERGQERLLATGRAAGYAPVWSPDGTALGYRHDGQRSCDVPSRSVTLDGARGPAPAHRHPGLWVRVVDDQVRLRRGTDERTISPAGDLFCCASLSPDSGAVTFMGLHTGVHVYDVATARITGLGPGAHPRFSADGRYLVFDRCEDDGHDLTACTLWLVELSGDAPVKMMIRGAHPLARNPALSPDGRHIAYDADGRIWIGRLE